MRMLKGTESLMAWIPFHSDTDILNMNPFGINSSLSFSLASSCCSAWWCWPPQEWIYIHKKLHFFCLVLNRGQGDFFEGNLDSLTVLGTGGQMLDFGMLFQKFIDAGFLNFSFILAIYLVADQNEREFFRFFWCSLIKELCDPRFDVIEGLNRSELTRLFVMS